MLVNLSNHSWSTWDEGQKLAIESKYGKVVDLNFPDIDPEADISEVTALARQFLDQTIQLFSSVREANNAIHICGEHCFVFQFVSMAREKGLVCVNSTTPRIVISGDHSETSIFDFVRLRSYY